ncbi:hypothetical protein DSCO28_03880 [Desulfosarcina ovata subsp. sediminis]|uniref:Flagellar protein FlgN n=1 Tax=Desulfosarcina ovata subsp. sediminis TaxID=885957 RepID=A0A5K7ZCV4_9BACT|nr:flagellar protein FlgN [Desulfosarcina ovata]BBO79822.1 hypothetical protein DSCO28_03880 [Desulfosarcina ovata subsp. sediminis]
MNPKLNQLLQVMDRETDCYQDMQTLLAEEKNTASLSNHDHLLKIGQKKQTLINALKQMEGERLQLVEALAREYGIADQEQPLTASRLAGYLDPEPASRLADRARALKRLIKQVHSKNNANAKLFSYYLELTHGALKMLNDLIYGHSVYAKPGTGARVSGYGSNRGKVFCGNI